MPDVAHDIDWKARALEAEASLAARPNLGRPAARATTADGKLVARVCAHLRLRRGVLALRLGVSPSILSRCNGGPRCAPLAERHREAMRAMLAEPGAPGLEMSRKGRQKSS